MTSHRLSWLQNGYDYNNGILQSAQKILVVYLNIGRWYDYLQIELAHHRIAGPFRKGLHSVQITKGHQLNEWRLIVDLSFPKNHSVNYRVPKNLCSLSYITIDDTIDTVCKFRLGTLLAKLYRYQEDVPPTACTSCIQTRQCLGVHRYLPFIWPIISIQVIQPFSRLLILDSKRKEYCSLFIMIII